MLPIYKECVAAAAWHSRVQSAGLFWAHDTLTNLTQGSESDAGLATIKHSEAQRACDNHQSSLLKYEKISDI